MQIIGSTKILNAADIYGNRAAQIVGVRENPSASEVSGGVKPNEGHELTPAFSLVSVVAVLIIIRVLSGMLPEG